MLQGSLQGGHAMMKRPSLPDIGLRSLQRCNTAPDNTTQRAGGGA